jgi:hypothetical protein
MLLCSCQYQPSQPSVGSRTPEHIQRCGDGTCEGPETPQNCPVDCLAKVTPTDPRETLTEPSLKPTNAKDPRPLLYLGLMIHLEGWGDDRDQEKFIEHANLVREYADLFERYGAKLTLESKELTDGSIRWGDNVLLEMEQRGHGIGVHADIGGSRTYDCGRFVSDLKAERLQLESLGVQVRHVSGNTSHCDWVRATIEAGYEFTSGIVAYNVMSLPIELRPEQYRDCPTPAQCHEVYPPDLEDRLHPWRTSDGLNWLEHDPKGELVILASDGGLYCIQEEMEGGVTSPCVFNVRDAEIIEDQIDHALALATPDQVNFIYFSWSLGKPLDQEILEALLQRIESYVADGRVAWATLPEIYDAYLTWELGG